MKREFARSSLLAILLVAVPTKVSGFPREPAKPAIHTESPAPEVSGQLSYRRSIHERRLETWRRYGDPTSKDHRGAAEELALLEALAEEALRRGLDQRPDVRVQLLRSQASLARPLLKRYLRSKISITEAEVETQFQATQHRYGLPRRVRLRNLFLRFPPQATKEQKAAVKVRMENLRQRIVDGEDFADVASRESQSTTRLRGGLMGNVRPGRLSPDLDAIVQSLAPGEMSQILESSAGLTVLFCEQILPAIARTDSEKRTYAREWLESRAFDAAWQELNERLRATADLVYRWAHQDGEPDLPFVRGTAGGWSVGEVTAALGGDALTSYGRGQIEAAVEQLSLSRMAVRELFILGLASDPSYEEKWAFKRLRILATHQVADAVAAQIERPTENELRAYFSEHREDFERDEMFRLSVISIPVDEAAHAADALAWRVLTELKQSKVSFAKAAEAYSSLPSATDGGDTGWIPRRRLSGRFGLDVLRAALTLRPDEISELFESEGAIWIVRLDDRQAKRPMTYEEARTSVENRLGQLRTEDLSAQVIEQWRQGLEMRWDLPETEPSP